MIDPIPSHIKAIANIPYIAIAGSIIG
jgi:hypothetical protein